MRPFLLSAVSIAVLLQSAAAYKSYVALIPNAGNIDGYPAIGHPDAAGEEGVNDFGTAFEAAGNEWTTALCQADTDGDGYTNGEELGDPCCTWTTSNTAGLITTGVSHPSLASLTPTNSALKSGCSTSTSTTKTTTTTTGSGSNATTTTGGDDDAGTSVVAPVSTTVTPGATPADDDEDDADESATLTADASALSLSLISMTQALAAVLALVV